MIKNFSLIPRRLQRGCSSISWAIQFVAHLGGYLEHHRKSPIGIQFKYAGVVGQICMIFVKVGFLLKFLLDGKSKLRNRLAHAQDLTSGSSWLEVIKPLAEPMTLTLNPSPNWGEGL